MRFSPDGKHLAVGSRNNVIYIYQVMDNHRKYDRIGRCVVRFSVNAAMMDEATLFFMRAGPFVLRNARGLEPRRRAPALERGRLRAAFL